MRNPPVPRSRGPGLRDGAAAKAESRRIPGRSPKVHDEDVHRVLKAINFALALNIFNPSPKKTSTRRDFKNRRESHPEAPHKAHEPR